jgi:hypothetical protein
MAAAQSSVPQLVIADTADGAFIPASAFTYMRYAANCRRLWFAPPAEFQSYEKFVTNKIDAKFGIAATEEKLEHNATELLRGDCRLDFVGLEEVENENR